MYRKGFTLIELLVVISIISLLSSVVLASLNSARDKARIAAGRQFDSSIYHVAGDQVMAVWDFDECAGAVANDSSGNGSTGALQGTPSWPTDTFSGRGCAMGLDGITQYADITVPSSALAISGDMTITAWVKRQTFTGSQNIVAKENVFDANYSLFFSGSSLAFTYSPGPVTRISSGTVTDTKWHHVAVTKNGTTLSFYIDGKSAGTATAAASILTTSTTMFIGNGFSGGPFSGSIDAVRIYAKTLTASAVEQLYAEGLREHTLADGR